MNLCCRMRTCRLSCLYLKEKTAAIRCPGTGTVRWRFSLCWKAALISILIRSVTGWSRGGFCWSIPMRFTALTVPMRIIRLSCRFQEGCLRNTCLMQTAWHSASSYGSPGRAARRAAGS